MFFISILIIAIALILRLTKQISTLTQAIISGIAILLIALFGGMWNEEWV